MNRKIAVGLVFVSISSFSKLVWADNATTKAIEHPEVAYDEHKVKSDAKEVDKQGMKMSESDQMVKESKATMEQAKKDYEKSLSSMGAENEVTKKAKSRYDDAKNDYAKMVKKSNHASHEMREDMRDLKKSKAELEKDKAEASH